MCSFIYSMLCALRCAIDLFVLNIPASTEISTYCHSLSRHDALPIWGWWSDVCPGAALTLRDATQADIERCTLRDNASRNTADWLCELGDRGSLVSRKAIAKLTVIESQAGLSATSNTAILDGEAPDKKNGSDLRPLSEQTHAIKSEAMAAAFRNPNALEI